MNSENLIPVTRRSKEEAREMSLKGGRASGKSRKQKAELKKLFIQYANMKPLNEEYKALEEMGFDKKNITNMTSYVVGLFRNGLNGNSKAMEIGIEFMTDYNKKELENEKLKQEIEKLKLECEKLRQETNTDSNSYEDLTPLVDKLNLE